MLNPSQLVGEGEKGHIVNSFANGFQNMMMNLYSPIKNIKCHSVAFFLILMFGV